LFPYDGFERRVARSQESKLVRKKQGVWPHGND